ncbi:AtzH-like domain-containing protein [Luteimicrobium sp. NPDC057192]|uniref:AtzH-like domain-containing protein n=1 Tax=Luteimicrobium sp. NPDC057192 TaxID=3346042 RepID=UPI003641DB45
MTVPATFAGDPAPEGLPEAFRAYETALGSDDLAALDRLFAPGPGTLRGDAAGLLVGHERISAYRATRGGAPARTISRVHVQRATDDAALVVAVTRNDGGGVGQQTQLWRRGAAGWKVAAAHVSHTPPAAIDGSVWRVAGTPLVAGAPDGPLRGRTVAVKDLFAVAGYAVGAGVPAFLAERSPEPAHAPAVRALLDAGADVVGIARTDELAYSVAGRNPHYGTPVNPAVPGGLPGGSSSGPATAVALGQADVGLGTDTAGSIRVPASYQGLWGLRTTHDAVSRAGLVPLAPRYDTVGWLARDAATLLDVACVGLAGAQQRAGAGRLAVVDLWSAGLDRSVAEEFRRTVAALTAAGFDVDPVAVDVGDLGELYEAFRVTQAYEAWRQHGPWVTAHPGALGPEVAARFRAASQVTAAEAAAADRAVAEARERIEEHADGRVLLLPSASSPAPDATAPEGVVEASRTATLRLTCLAGITGRPSVSAPLMGVDGAPVGLGFVGMRDGDLATLALAQQVAGALRASRREDPVTARPDRTAP